MITKLFFYILGIVVYFKYFKSDGYILDFVTSNNLLQIKLKKKLDSINQQ